MTALSLISVTRQTVVSNSFDRLTRLFFAQYNINGQFKFPLCKQKCCYAGAVNGKNNTHRQERGQKYGQK